MNTNQILALCTMWTVLPQVDTSGVRRQAANILNGIIISSNMTGEGGGGVLHVAESNATTLNWPRRASLDPTGRISVQTEGLPSIRT